MEDAPVVEVLHPLEDLDQVRHHVVLGVAEPVHSKWRLLAGEFSCCVVLSEFVSVGARGRPRPPTCR